LSGIFFEHFAGIDFHELGNTKDFVGINFRELGSTKVFMGINFHGFVGINFAFALRNSFSTTLVYGFENDLVKIVTVLLKQMRK